MSVVGGSVIGVRASQVGAGSVSVKGEHIMAVCGDGDCLDGPEGCGGETFPRVALSGSGDAYSRCDAHHEAYAARLQQSDSTRDGPEKPLRPRLVFDQSQ